MIEFESIEKELKKQLANFEKKFGNLSDFWQKQLIQDLHIMNLEDDFFQPDLIGLEKYEKELDVGNKKR